LVTPGLIETDINKGKLPDEKKRDLDDPAGPSRRADDVAGCVRVPGQRPVRLLHRHHARRERRHVDPLTDVGLANPHNARRHGTHEPQDGAPSPAPLEISDRGAGLLPWAGHAQTDQAHARPRRRPGQPPARSRRQVRRDRQGRTNGRIEVQVAHSAQLGDDAAMVTALRSAHLDMSANSQGAVANVVPEYAASACPSCSARAAKAFKLLDGPLGKELADKSAAKGWSCWAPGTTASAR
jgi:hypothetical protein